MYDYDPKFYNGDGGVEFVGKGSKSRVVENAGNLIIREIMQLPYDGSEPGITTVFAESPTYGQQHEFTNRPA